MHASYWLWFLRLPRRRGGLRANAHLSCDKLSSQFLLALPNKHYFLEPTAFSDALARYLWSVLHTSLGARRGRGRGERAAGAEGFWEWSERVTVREITGKGARGLWQKGKPSFNKWTQTFFFGAH